VKQKPDWWNVVDLRKRLAAYRSCWKSFVEALCSYTGDSRKLWWWLYYIAEDTTLQWQVICMWCSSVVISCCDRELIFTYNKIASLFLFIPFIVLQDLLAHKKVAKCYTYINVSAPTLFNFYAVEYSPYHKIYALFNAAHHYQSCSCLWHVFFICFPAESKYLIVC
jgi:hypothetical protein